MKLHKRGDAPNPHDKTKSVYVEEWPRRNQWCVIQMLSYRIPSWDVNGGPQKKTVKTVVFRSTSMVECEGVAKFLLQ